MLTFLKSGVVAGDGHHAASVSTSCLVTGGEGTSSAASKMVGISAQNNLNFNSTLMSGINSIVPFVPTLEHSIFSAKTVDRKIFRETDWIIDTGATDHMVHFISCFTSITATLNTFVNLPNGETTLVTHVGTVKVSKTLILTNVLCVPSFSFNLLSVSQLAKTTLCCLIFFGTMCFIQDLAHWSTIGLGREFKGLYLLEESLSTSRTCFFAAGFVHSFTDQPSTMFVNNLVVQPNIWHLRLGHLSNAKLALIRNNNVPLSTINKDVHCEICPLAKQKRLHFPSSTHVSLECFNLIHCDL